MRLFLLACASLLSSAVLAAPLPFRLCTLDQPFYPYTLPDGSGQLQQLLRLAVQDLPLALSNVTAPRKRCLEGLRTGQYQALMGLYAPERLAYAAYPGEGQRGPDDSQALAQIDFAIYRQVGHPLRWDGQQFANLGGKAIGVQLGFALAIKLQSTGVAMDEGARSAEQNFDKLLLGRLAGVVAQTSEAERLLQQARFTGRIEAISPLFDRTVLHLMVARPFYTEHSALIDQLWQNIRSTRASPAYQKYLQQYR